MQQASNNASTYQPSLYDTYDVPPPRPSKPSLDYLVEGQLARTL